MRKKRVSKKLVAAAHTIREAGRGALEEFAIRVIASAKKDEQDELIFLLTGLAWAEREPEEQADVEAERV